ncbi:hypothetical protein [Burkholderia sp. MSMB1459WGS]|uniref:hypothetical protein n=1 Tax=Burkholderia sp. MSMB1459WGS TaxID=1637970 RepID=UPI000B0F7610|nr:hypothetical protein [Burkholderia sp. MSMB1459WGS]
MKKSRVSGEQIIEALKEADAGMPAELRPRRTVAFLGSLEGNVRRCLLIRQLFMAILSRLNQCQIRDHYHSG